MGGHRHISNGNTVLAHWMGNVETRFGYVKSARSMQHSFNMKRGVRTAWFVHTLGDIALRTIHSIELSVLALSILWFIKRLFGVSNHHTPIMITRREIS